MSGTPVGTAVQSLAGPARSLGREIPGALAIVALAFATAAAAQVTILLPFTPVPMTLQPTVVLLAGAALGARRGAISQLVYLAAGMIGLQAFAWSPLLLPGAARLVGPTGGYLLSYPAAAFVVGLLVERGFGRRYLTSVIALGAGLLVVFAGGLLGLLAFGSLTGGIDEAIRLGVIPFLVPDAIKVCLVAGLLPRLARPARE